MPDPEGLLVPVSDTDTVDRTVRYALKESEEVHFVVAVDGRRRGRGVTTHDEAEALLDKAEVWAKEEIEADSEAEPDDEEGIPDGPDTPDVSSEVLVSDGYLFSPSDYAGLFAAYCEEHGIGRVLLDPEYSVSATTRTLQPLATSLRGYGLAVDQAPVERATRRPRVLTRGGAARFVTVFVLSYAFYLGIGGLGVFDLVTGAVTALLVSAVLYRVSFETSPVASRIPAVTGRLLLYVPYLGWEVLKANAQIAYVVLHPDLPIDPSVEEFEAMVWGGFPITTLANSITLTPGTLTVDSEGRTLHVHSLTESARESLLNGGLERGVRFVFYGRRSMDYPTPRERGDVVGDEDGVEEGADV